MPALAPRTAPLPRPALLRTRRAVRIPRTLRVVLAALLGAGLSMAGGEAAAAPSDPWAWPVAVPVVVRGYEAPDGPYGAGHRGIDIAAAAGDPVYAVADGAVHFAGRVVDRDVVSIDHGGGVLSSVEPVRSELRLGERVRRGDVIGFVEPGGAHLAAVHLGARIDGAYLDPRVLITGIPRAVLLPVE